MSKRDTLFDINPEAIFSPCGNYRFRLERRWGRGKGVLCIMLNPSLAGSAKRTDHTTEKCITLWKNLGFNAHIAVNLWPFISPYPKDMKANYVSLSSDNREEIWRKNIGTILYEAKRSGLVVAAWGRCFSPEIAEKVTAALHRANHEIYCLGTNQDGSPRHPLSRGKNHVPVNQQPILWRAAA